MPHGRGEQKKNTVACLYNSRRDERGRPNPKIWTCDDCSGTGQDSPVLVFLVFFLGALGRLPACASALRFMVGACSRLREESFYLAAARIRRCRGSRYRVNWSKISSPQYGGAGSWGWGDIVVISLPSLGGAPRNFFSGQSEDIGHRTFVLWGPQSAHIVPGYWFRLLLCAAPCALRHSQLEPSAHHQVKLRVYDGDFHSVLRIVTLTQGRDAQRCLAMDD